MIEIQTLKVDVINATSLKLCVFYMSNDWRYVCKKEKKKNKATCDIKINYGDIVQY